MWGNYRLSDFKGNDHGSLQGNLLANVTKTQYCRNLYVTTVR